MAFCLDVNKREKNYRKQNSRGILKGVGGKRLPNHLINHLQALVKCGGIVSDAPVVILFRGSLVDRGETKDT